MRVLFLHHLPIEQGEVGPHLQRWMEALTAAGHTIRLLTVDHQRHPADAHTIERVVCSPSDPHADLPFDVPDFSVTPHTGMLAFAALADEQLSQYRDVLRRHLDSQIDRFDPHVIHAQHIWLWGQLAVETGVPYALSAWEAELAEYASDGRYRPLAEQAADNAGRILAHDPAVFGQVAELFAPAERTLLMPLVPLGADAENAAARQAYLSDSLVAVYETVFEERFGRRP